MAMSGSAQVLGVGHPVIPVAEGEHVAPPAAEEAESSIDLLELVEVEREVEDVVLQLVGHGLRATVADHAAQQVRA
jgi:hypothetical protein